MDRKIVLLIVAAMLIVAGVAYVMTTQNSSASNSTDNTTNVATTLHNESSHSNNSHVKTNDTGKVKISAAEAQKIAVKAIKDDFGETYIAGTPTLFKIKGTPWWDVPLDEANGTYVGSLDVNAITGETMGQW